jgi:hypothetical protein
VVWLKMESQSVEGRGKRSVKEEDEKEKRNKESQERWPR